MRAPIRIEGIGDDARNSVAAGGSTELALALAEAARQAQRPDVFVGVAGRALSQSPLRVGRLFVSMKALHPGFRARTYLWRQNRNRVRTVEWPHGLENRPGYADSPDQFVHRTGSELRVRNPGASGERACDLYGTLRRQGYTDYLIVPLRLGDGTTNTLSIATSEADGFREHDLAGFRELVPLFTIILERYAALETLDAVLETYLGRSVSQQIRRGHIQVGDGELIDAAILMADLHDFTEQAARLNAADTVRLLNAYFDCLVGPISEHGGHVLKFIGDAVLAFFPLLAGGQTPMPFAAVLAIRQRLAALNEARRKSGQEPLRHALCLHRGRVLYGNIGSSDRLDFTIIGEAVNLTARGVEAAKKLKRDYLFTAAFVEHFGAAGLVRCGRHTLRGILGPVDLFSLDVSDRSGRSADGFRGDGAAAFHDVRHGVVAEPELTTGEPPAVQACGRAPWRRGRNSPAR